MKKTVAYMRMSTDKQEYSIDSQFRLIKSFAKHNGYNLINTYIDEGISGRNAEKRPAFMRMIEDSSKNMFEYVLIYDSSRFARNLEQSIVYKSLLKRNGVTLISITEPIIDDDTSLITDALLGAMNEMYSRKLSKVVKRGMEQKALGNEYFSCAPYGYKKPHKKPLEIIDDEAKIVKFVYQRFLENNSSFKIARELNSLNIKTKRGNPFDKRQIEKILTNPTYKGYMLWKTDERTYYKKANHKAIIDEKTFDMVQEKYTERKKLSKRRERPCECHKHWLSGILRCPVCDTVYVYAKGYNKSDRFRCGGYINGKCLISKSFKVEDLEKIIIGELYSIIKYEKKYYNLKFNKTETNSIQNLTIKEINQLKKSLKRAKEAYLSGIDTLDEYKKSKEYFQVQIKEKEKTLKEKNSKKNNNNENKIKSIMQIIEEDGDTEKKIKLIKTIIEKITLNGSTGEMAIYFYG